MKRVITQLVFAFTAVAAVLVTWVSPVSAEGSLQDGVNSAQGNGVPTDLFGDTGILTQVTNLLLFVAGALAVIMIIIGGLRYVLSGGNGASVTAAKNTVMYAVVGLIIAFLAFAAINFVLGMLADGSQSGWTNA